MMFEETPGVRGGHSGCRSTHIPGRKTSGCCQMSGSCWAASRLGTRTVPATTGSPPRLEGTGGTEMDWGLLGTTESYGGHTRTY